VSFLMCPFCVRATASVLATHLCDVTRPATSAVTGYEGPGWTGQLEQQLMPLLQDYGSVVVEDRRQSVAAVADRGEMTTPAATLADSLASLELEQSQPRVYDRPIQMRLL
jgi:hypothetical protein